MISRRGLLTGLGTLLAAPAIVRVSSLMPVKAWTMEYQWVPDPELSRMSEQWLAQLERGGAAAQRALALCREARGALQASALLNNGSKADAKMGDGAVLKGDDNG